MANCHKYRSWTISFVIAVVVKGVITIMRRHYYHVCKLANQVYRSMWFKSNNIIWIYEYMSSFKNASVLGCDVFVWGLSWYVMVTRKAVLLMNVIHLQIKAYKWQLQMAYRFGKILIYYIWNWQQCRQFHVAPNVFFPVQHKSIFEYPYCI